MFNSLDPDTLLEGMLTRLNALSDGNIQPGIHSPIRVIFEAVALALVEYGYELNKVPDETVIRLLQVAGLQLTGGTKATGNVTIQLLAPATSNLAIPLGTGFTTPDGLIFYSTVDSSFTIGTDLLTVPVESELVGAKYNVPARNITQILASLALGSVDSVYNSEPMSGGSNAETEGESLELAKNFMREDGNLVTANDFRLATLDILGVGSRAIIIPNLSENRLEVENQTVHINALKPDESPLTNSEKTNIIDTISGRILVGTTIYVSDISLIELRLQVVLKLASGNPGDCFNEVLNRVKSYLDPLSWPSEQSVMYKELEYLARDNPYTSYIQSVAIATEGSEYQVTNIPMPTPWHLPKLGHLNVELVDTNGVTYSYGYGLFDDEPEQQIFP